jgi:hypothetical protein
MSISKFPTLGQTVPIYNFLFDNIEEYQKNKNLPVDINDAISNALQKLDDYYPTSDGLVYIIATSMFLFFYIYIILNF